MANDNVFAISLIILFILEDDDIFGGIDCVIQWLT